MEIKPFKNLTLNHTDILKSLSKTGVFITDYISGEILPSELLTSHYDFFSSKGKIFLNNIHSDDLNRIRKSRNDIMKGDISEFSEIYRVLQGEDSYLWISTVGQIVKRDEEGKPTLVVGAHSDITELKETEEKLRRSIEQEKKRSEELVTLREIMSEIGSTLDTKETIKKSIKQLKRVIPYETCSLQFLEGDALHVRGGEGFSNMEEVLKLTFPFPAKDSLSTRTIQEKTPYMAGNLLVEFPSFIQPSPTRTIYSWLGIPLVTRGVVTGILALDGYSKNQFNNHHLELAKIIGDHISIALENAMLHEKAYKEAMEDSLTGLANRRRMELEGRLIFERAARKNCSLSFVMLDIDYFKKVNDNHGHDKGDIVLKTISRISQECLRAASFLARYGGEEFILILPETTSNEAFEAVERIRKDVGNHFFKEINGKITLSAGIFTGIPLPNETMSSFVIKADEALYKAKESGRNRTVLTKRD
jgi:diguanylate cyclase (GGDEF)-like protein